MIRTITLLITVILFFAIGDASIAQTQSSHNVLIQNLSREFLIVQNVRTLQEDGSMQDIEDITVSTPGTNRMLMTDGKGIKGRQLFCKIKTMDGIVLNCKTISTQPIEYEGQTFIVFHMDDDILKKYRSDDSNRRLSKSEATYRYWNRVHGIIMDETVNVIQTAQFLDLSLIPASLRKIANSIDDLDTSNIDDDAVAAAQSYSAVLRESVKIWSGRGVSSVGVVLAELYNLKVDTLGKIINEDQALAGKTEDVYQFMHSRKKNLEKRYSALYPHLTPPVMIILPPYLIEKGYYVQFVNTSGRDMTNVDVRYTGADFSFVREKGLPQVRFNPQASPGITAKISDFILVQPHLAPWRVDPNEWVTIICDDWIYSMPTNKLIRNRLTTRNLH